MIMREKLVELLMETFPNASGDREYYVYCAYELIANGVTVHKNGKWVVENEASIRCSECCFNRVSIKMPMDYCPICGAHMRTGG
jgi:Zn finger protein HypA/HybF involved in hydrogenase expression